MMSFYCDGWACRSLLGLLVVVVLAIVLGWLAPVHPLFEVITVVRAQMLPFAIVPVVGFVLLQRWQLAGAAAVALAIVISWLVPYWTATADPLPEGGETVAAMQYNIFFGNDDYEAMARHIVDSDADVVALHELLPEQWSGLEPFLVAYPHRIAAPLAETDGQPGGGMALLSRTPLTRIETDESFSPPERVTLVATTELDGQQVMLIGLHPHASRTDSQKVALRQAQLDGVAALVNRTETPAIVLTDLNVTPTSPLYQDFLDDMDWRDPHRVVGWQSSWPTWDFGLGLPIDHVLVSNDIALHGYVTGDGAGSDHKSVTALLSLGQDAAGS